jgi:hypothetical protein
MRQAGGLGHDAPRVRALQAARRRQPGRPVIHGRYSAVLRGALRDKAGAFATDASPGDLGGELAILRALPANYLGRLADTDAVAPD